MKPTEEELNQKRLNQPLPKTGLFLELVSAESTIAGSVVLPKWSPPPGRVLDIGCKSGYMISILEQVGYEAEGIDLMQEFAYMGMAMYRKITVGDVSYIDEYFPPEYFDCLYGSHILEHLDDPQDALRRMRKIIKPLGIALFLIPIESINLERMVETENRHRYFFPDEVSIQAIIPNGWWLEQLVDINTQNPQLESQWCLILKATEASI